MLTFHTRDAADTTMGVRGAAGLPDGVDWIDVLKPDAAETANLEKLLGIEVPTIERLVEIESSSRLSRSKGFLVLSLPAVYRDASGAPATTPIGFVLSRDLLVTLRFEDLKAFSAQCNHVRKQDGFPEGGYGAFIAILDVIIDLTADVLERVGADLDATSRQIFGHDSSLAKPARPQQENMRLRAMLRGVGHNGDLTSRISESLLGMARMIPYVLGNPTGELSDTVKTRLENLQRDIVSLNDYETHLTDKIQFLLDTTLGLANIEQNNVFRVLTVVSVIGIPPTFLASMYGMNFKNMPEYDWTYGYAWGLTLIFLSAVLPALWFKRRGWW